MGNDQAWVLRTAIAFVTLGSWSCSATTPEAESPLPPPLSPSCSAFVQHFEKPYQAMITGMVFRANDTKLPLVRPSTDSKRIGEIARALEAPVPVAAEPRLTEKTLKAGQAHVDVMKGLLDAVSTRDVAAYLELSKRYAAVHDELHAINRDIKATCGRFLAQARLPPEIIQSTVREAYPVFQKCYEAGLARDPTLTGLVAVKFVIDMNGDVRDVQRVTTQASEGSVPDAGTEGFFESLGFRQPPPVSRVPLPDEEVVECIVDHFRTLRFPRPETGMVTVIYPINLEPG